MTDTKAENIDICEACGCPIPNAVFMERGLFGLATCRQTKCADCAFHAEFRARTYKRRPYQVPGLRPKPDGRAPDVYVASFEDQKSRRINAAEGIDQ